MSVLAISLQYYPGGPNQSSKARKREEKDIEIGKEELKLS